MIGRIERMTLREVWKHEAYDFTTWLQSNLDVLNTVLDLDLVSAEREQSAGTFNVDLVAEDRSGNSVIIENQLERSNHDHLGKLITYLTAFDSKTAIWIVSDPRPEHVRAISWLNESTDASFFLVKAEVIRIGTSLPAPLLTIIVGPSSEAREVGQVKRQLAERHHQRHAFWKKFLEYAKTQTHLHAAISPSYETWVGTGAGKMGLSYNYVVNLHQSRVELYIDRGKDAAEENKAIFDQLQANREMVDKEFGDQLDWQRLDEKQACRIAKPIIVGGYRDEERYSQLFEEMVDAMVRLERALRPQIARLRS